MDYLIAFGCGALGAGLAQLGYYLIRRSEKKKYQLETFLRSLER
jgi:hypothetical protein